MLTMEIEAEAAAVPDSGVMEIVAAVVPHSQVMEIVVELPILEIGAAVGPLLLIVGAAMYRLTLQQELVKGGTLTLTL